MLGKPDLAMIAGFSITGDFGPYTWYTRANGAKVAFPRNYLDGKEATPARVAQRDKWRAAATDWNRLTSAERARWANAVRKLSLPITGYNLWVYWHVQKDDATVHTIENQSGFQLLPPSYEGP